MQPTGRALFQQSAESFVQCDQTSVLNFVTIVVALLVGLLHRALFEAAMIESGIHPCICYDSDSQRHLHILFLCCANVSCG
jgi:hypothetical protein